MPAEGLTISHQKYWEWHTIISLIIWLDRPNLVFMINNFQYLSYTVIALFLNLSDLIGLISFNLHEYCQCLSHTDISPFLNPWLLSLWSNVIIRIIGCISHGCMLNQFVYEGIQTKHRLGDFDCIKMYLKSVKPAVQHGCHESVLYSF